MLNFEPLLGLQYWSRGHNLKNLESSLYIYKFGVITGISDAMVHKIF